MAARYIDFSATEVHISHLATAAPSGFQNHLLFRDTDPENLLAPLPPGTQGPKRRQLGQATPIALEPLPAAEISPGSRSRKGPFSLLRCPGNILPEKPKYCVGSREDDILSHLPQPLCLVKASPFAGDGQRDLRQLGPVKGLRRAFPQRSVSVSSNEQRAVHVGGGAGNRGWWWGCSVYEEYNHYVPGQWREPLG